MAKGVILALLLFSFLNNHAQFTGIIQGRVIARDGFALAAASVSISGNATTLTDDQGNFIVKTRGGKVQITCSYVGYVPQYISLNTDTLNSRNRITIVLLPEQGRLAEVNIPGIKRKSATATRMLLQVQDIPQAVVVMGQKVIQQQAAFDLTTITRNISGLNYTGSYSGGGSYQLFNARGFDLSNSQNYRWNGQMIWNLGNNYADNIEQVEFLKGPTSILFGDVSPGGVLNFVSKKPLQSFGADVNIKLGEWGLYRPSVDITGPLTKDKTLLYRLNASYEQSNSFRDFVNERRWLIAPTLSWSPMPSLAITFEAVIRHSSSTDDAGIVSPDGTAEGLSHVSPHLYLGEPSRRYLFSDQSYFLTSSYNIFSNWRLRMVNFYGYTTNRPWGIWPGQPDELGNLERRQYGYNQWLSNVSTSADIMGNFYTGAVKHSVVAGFDVQSTNFRYSSEGYLSFFDSINIFHPVHGVTPNVLPPAKYLPFTSILRRTGLYAQDQVMFFKEKLHLLLGIRAGKTEQGNRYNQQEAIGTDYEGYNDDVISKNVVTPRAGLVYKPVSFVSVYASWSKGYELNSPDIFARNYKDYANPPATLSTQVEFGAKAGLLKNELGISLTFFRIDKRNPYGYTYVTDSAGNVNYDVYDVYYKGHHRSEGIELDADGKLAKNLSIVAGAAYTHTKVIEDPGYPSGNQLPNAPKFTGNCWLNYNGTDKLAGVTFGAGIFYKGKFFSFISNDPSLVIPANYTIDVSAGYKWKQFGCQLNISNVTNRVSYLNPWAYIIYDVQPLRRGVITFTYKFIPRKKN